MNDAFSVRSRAVIGAGLLVVCFFSGIARSQLQTVDSKLYHLRVGDREWSEFPEEHDGARLRLRFSSKANAEEQTLLLRQVDVKGQWFLSLNGKMLGKLRVDENDMVDGFAVPPGTLVEGNNEIVIEQNRLRPGKSDDIRVGEIRLDPRPIPDSLQDAVVTVRIKDSGSGESLPCRVTILNAGGSLQRVGAVSNDHLAVRPGIVYTSNGSAQFGLPVGDYEIIVGRGFEYSIARTNLSLARGDRVTRELSIRRVVDTTGYVACDPHTHSLTHSGHGDATVEERMITIAGEGIELPIATDHNRHIDQEPFAEKMGVRRYFTPVIGNEVTTKVGHFNIWPVASDKIPCPDWKSNDWAEIFAGIFAVPGVKAVILNHGRDLHGGTTPLGPKLHNHVVGQNLDGWRLRANAMEIFNSGAAQTNVFELTEDWMRLLNRGFRITPAGTSDSHDVGRHFVGQGRTYIRIDDRDPGNIDVSGAADSFAAGKVLVSYGLLAELEIAGQKSGEIVRHGPGKKIVARVRISGPEWVEASQFSIFANGHLVHAQKIEPRRNPENPGLIWEDDISLSAMAHDQHIVLFATGPGVGLHWKTAKPYQPDSLDFTPRVAACSGAIWVDGDGDGIATSARGYAEKLWEQANQNTDRYLKSLAGFDRAVSEQAANLLYQKDRYPGKAELGRVGGTVEEGFSGFLQQQRKSEEIRKQSP